MRTNDLPKNAERKTCTAPASISQTPIVRRGGGASGRLSAVHTGLLTLTPAFLDELRKVAPKKPRSKVRYVVALAVVAVVAALGSDASTREFGLARGAQLAARLHQGPAASSVSTLAAMTVAPALTPSVVPPVTAAAAAASVNHASEPAAAPSEAPTAAESKPAKSVQVATSAPRKAPKSAHSVRPAKLQQHRAARPTTS
jgi:hypothetical protein